MPKIIELIIKEREKDTLKNTSINVINSFCLMNIQIYKLSSVNLHKTLIDTLPILITSLDRVYLSDISR